MSSDTKKVLLFIAGFLVLLSMCQSDNSGGGGGGGGYDPYCYQGPRGYECD